MNQPCDCDSLGFMKQSKDYHEEIQMYSVTVDLSSRHSGIWKKETREMSETTQIRSSCFSLTKPSKVCEGVCGGAAWACGATCI